MRDKANIIIRKTCIAQHFVLFRKFANKLSIITFELSKYFGFDCEAKDICLDNWWLNDNTWYSC